MALLMMTTRHWTVSSGVRSTTNTLLGRHQNQVRIVSHISSSLSSPEGLIHLPTEANPFAKKPNGASDGSRNPFGRDNPNNKSLHKSESFFDKAEAAETGKWKGLPHLPVVCAPQKKTIAKYLVRGCMT